MTALTLSGEGGAAAGSAPPRATPARVTYARLAWAAWRQYRLRLLALAVLCAGFAVWELLTGLRVRQVYGQYTRDHCGTMAAAHACAALPSFEAQPIDEYPAVVAIALHVLPVLVAVFLAAPLLAAELERGTWRFAWTQGAGRSRWLLTRLILLATAVTLAGAALGALGDWLIAPYDAVGIATPWQGGQFDVTVITEAGWCLLGFAAGILVGALTKQVVGAMATAGGVVIGLIGVTFFRLDTRLLAAPRGMAQRPEFSWLSFQPASRYWLFQSLAGGALGVTALALLAAAAWIVRRRLC